MWIFACSAVFVSLLTGCGTAAMPRRGFDAVILNGRVIDPETKLDAVRNVGLSDGRIAAITDAALEGRTSVDAQGLVVAPGFIDLHAHGQQPVDYAIRATDGVTSALELEVGTADIDRWYDERAGHALINHGVSIGHIPVRMAVMGDAPAFLPPATAKANTEPASDQQIAEIRRGIERGLVRGAPAVGFGIQYTGAASRWEILEAFRAAAAAGASCHVHMRHNGTVEPSSTTALEEVIAAATITGAPLHVVHIHSTSVRNTPRHLQMIAEARGRGLDVTTECYPYTFGMTNLASAVFDGNFREGLQIDYKDIQWVETGERLTAETFASYRKQGGLVAIHSIPESAVAAAVVHPLVMIASDGVMEKGKGHPRSAGTYSRVLGRFVREQHALTLIEALRKMTLMPAERLERRAPEMKRKGRLQVGADADITVFDPERIIDRATLEAPGRAPDGIPHVFVSGVAVVRDGQVQAGVFPGRAIRAPVR